MKINGKAIYHVDLLREPALWEVIAVEMKHLQTIATAARDVLTIWDANEWAERADGGELSEAIAALRQAAEQKARE